MSEELHYFNEDAQEQLQMMESALLDAMDKGVNDEYIGTIFRAMHTIKGVAGMFSFEEIISFTHIAENLMDAVRNGKIVLDEALLMLLLRCKDHVASLVESAVASTSLGVQTQDEDKKLKELIHSYLSAPAQDRQNAVPIQTQQTQQVDGAKVWHLHLLLKESFFDTGMDLLAILSYLKKLGTVRSIEAELDKLPLLVDIDPFIPYMSFSIDFESDADEADIVEVFEFVEDDIVLKLQVLEQTQLKLEEPKEATQEAIQEVPKNVEKQPNIEIKKQTPSQSLRVDSAKIDLLIDTISEMVIANAKIARYVEQNYDADLEEVSLELETLLETLRNNVMQIRMLPVGESFEKFRRVVNDVAHKLGKKINFTILGGDTELDKTVIEK
ncbi:MAG: Hpt domain-containing protein, partial [Sulfurimonas sp.]